MEVKHKILIEFSRPCIDRQRFISFSNSEVFDSYEEYIKYIKEKLAKIFNITSYDVTIFDSDDTEEYQGRIDKDYFSEIYFNIEKVVSYE